jgi:hypothetical protein
MRAMTQSRLSTFYLECKANKENSYPVERELYRFIEPSQSETRDPENFYRLYLLLTNYYTEIIPRDAVHLYFGSATGGSVQLMTLAGINPLTIYVDPSYDTPEYLISRVAFYSEVDKSRVMLTMTTGTTLYDLTDKTPLSSFLASTCLKDLPNWPDGQYSYAIRPPKLKLNEPFSAIPAPLNLSPLNLSPERPSPRPLNECHTPTLITEEIDYEDVD